jgi:hypothetical protein
MGPARRLFSFVCSLGLTLAGFVLALWGFSNGGRGWLFMAAGTMLFAGACWLWSDFINATPNDQLGRFKQKANGRQRQQDANWEREPTAEAQEWWHILDVSPHAKKDEISRSYRRKMQQCHPDRVSGLAPEFHRLAETHAKTLNAAYAEAMGRRA